VECFCARHTGALSQSSIQRISGILEIGPALRRRPSLTCPDPNGMMRSDSLTTER
jgi:hypothetical protein